jgi:hypothetical protein
MAKFAKGQSGNPGGRPKTIALLRDLAQRETEASIRVLIEIRDSRKAPFAARIAAIRELFDRGYGRPTQPISGDDSKEAVKFVMLNRPVPSHVTR